MLAVSRVAKLMVSDVFVVQIISMLDDAPTCQRLYLFSPQVSETGGARSHSSVSGLRHAVVVSSWHHLVRDLRSALSSEM